MTTEIPYPVATQKIPSVLRPSLSDLFFLVLLVWLFVVSPVGWSRTLLDADTWLHTRIGEIILSTGSVPHQDLFAFSKVGGPWYAFEWLSEVTLAMAYRISGLKGISALAAVLITLYLTLLLKHSIAKGANGMVALVITLVAATASSIHFHARPHLFTLLLLTISLWILDSNRRSAHKHLVWVLVPLSALWANLHGGFFIFLALLAIRFVGCAAEAFFYAELKESRRNEAIQLALVGLAAAAATLLNPYGYHLHEHIFETLKSPWIVSNVAEFQSPRFRSEEMLNSMLMIFAGLSIVSSLLRQRNLVDTLSILFLSYCSLTSVRHIPILMLVLVPILSLEVTLAWDWLALGKKKSSLLAILHDVTRQLTPMMKGTSLFIPLAVLGILLMPGLNWPTEIPEGAVPIRLIEKHADRIATSRIFAPDQMADYLIYRNYPKQKVYFDSRHNYYGPEVGNEYFAIRGGGRNWSELLDKYRFDLVLITADEPLSALLAGNSGWLKVDSNERHILFERKETH